MAQPRGSFFISYTKSDEPWAVWIAWELEAASFNATLMAWDFRPGESFVRRMQDELVGGSRMLLVLSNAYLKSEFCASEWEAGFGSDPSGARRRLIPVRIELCDPPGLLSRLGYIDLVGRNIEEARGALLSGVTGARRKPTHSPAFPGLEDTVLSETRFVPAFPADLPSVWTVPLPRNPFFRGREAILRKLHDALLVAGGSSSERRTVALHGLGGTGKTQIAVEYAHMHRDDYETVLWIPAESPVAIRARLAELANELPLGVVVSELGDEQSRIDAVRRWLGNHTRWLLLFDAADDAEAIRAAMEVVPHGVGGHVLLTSRVSVWGTTTVAIGVGVFSREVAVDFLQARVASLGPIVGDEETTRQLARELGDLPLALEQAAAHLLRHRWTLADYLHQLTDSRSALLAVAEPGATEYPSSVSAALLVSEQRLGLEARAILGLLAFLSSDEIPRVLLDFAAPAVGLAMALVDPQVPDTAGSHKPDKQSIRAALIELADHSLIQLTPAYVSCHRLLQAAFIDRVTSDERGPWIEAVMRMLQDALPNQADEAHSWPAWGALLSHVLSAVKHARAAGMDMQSLLLLNGLGLFANARAAFADAESVFRHILNVHLAVATPDTGKVALALNNLAEVLRTTGRFVEAEPLMRQAMATNEAIFGACSPPVATSVNNLALLLTAMNRFAEAEPLQRHALALCEELSGPGSVQTALALSNLGELLRTLNRLDEAEPLYRRALAIEEQVRGADDPHVARVLNNLALLLLTAHRVPEAEVLLRRAIKIQETHLGPDHPTVAVTLGNMAELLKVTSDLAGAEQMLRRALEIDEASLGATHPSVGRDLANLATLMQGTNRFSEAESLYRRALALSEDGLGEEHSDVATVLSTLGHFVATTGRFAEAEGLLARALAIDERCFGPWHPSVARDLNHLALLRFATNRLVEAEAMLRRSIAISERCFGSEHPHVGVASTNMAELLRAMGRFSEAETFARRALAIGRAAFGEGHPSVALAINNVALLLIEGNRLSEAKELLVTTLGVFEATLGDSHPLVATTLNNLGEAHRREGNYIEAEPLFRRALAISEASFGPNHMDVARGASQVALVLLARGASAEAEALFRRAIRTYEHVLGDQHPSLSPVLTSLAELLRLEGRLDDARDLAGRALAIAEASFGPRHPSLAMLLNNLALVQFDFGDLKEAERLLREAVEISAEAFGQEHPGTRQFLGNLEGLLNELR